MRFLRAFAASSSRGTGPLRVTGNRFVHPLDPFRRVEPSVAQRDEPSGFQGFRFETLATH